MRIPTACLFLALAATPAIAQPVVGSDPRFGSGAITGDPSQNLVFLDLTVTEGISLAAMKTELLPGGAYERWRYATPSEVAAFINSFGWSPPISGPSLGEVLVAGSTGRTIVEDYIGVTFETFDGLPSATGYLENGNVIRIGFEIGFGPVSTFNLFSPVSSADTGHWLVRDVVPNAPTYQGTLAESGTPFDGVADFRATLTSRFGVPLETIEHAGVAVFGGLFKIPLSFDSALFESPGATLRIEVRAPSGVGEYQALTPDQPVSPAPSAVFAQNASLADFALNADTAASAAAAMVAMHADSAETANIAASADTATLASNALNADSADVAMSLSNEASVPLPLSAGTEPYGAGYSSPVVTRIGNLVVLNGLVRDVGISNAEGTVFATLPAGFRPTARLLFLQASSGGVYRVDVLPSGELQFLGAPGVGGAIDWVSLDGISFRIE
ncbi:MAG: hypothetical protein AAGG07_02600 [Planctomycetota bacterium]